jgi:hypothetical protein
MKRTSERTLPAVVASLSTLTLLTACGGSQDPATSGVPADARAVILAAHSSAEESGHSEQAEIFSDGIVSEDEYRGAFRMLQACYAEIGVTASEPIVSPVDGHTLVFNTDLGGLSEEAALPPLYTCDERFWMLVDAVYSYSNPQVMEPALLQAVKECIRVDGGDPPEDAKSVPELVDGDNPGPVDTCVHTQMAKLYPEITSVTVRY